MTGLASLINSNSLVFGIQLIQLVFVGVVIQNVVQLFARLHLVDDISLSPFVPYRFVNANCRRTHRAKCAQRVQNKSNSNPSEFFDREQRRLSKLCDIRQDRDRHRLGKGSVIFQGIQRLSENHVRADLDVRRSPVDPCLHPFRSNRVGASHHHKLIVRARIHRSLDSIHHFSRGNERLVRAVPASLGLLLIFQVTACGSGAGQIADGPGNIERTPPACVRISKERYLSSSSDPTHIFTNIVQSRDPEVRQSKRSVCGSRSGKIEPFKSCALGQSRAIGVDRTRYLKRDLFFNSFSQIQSCRHNSSARFAAKILWFCLRQTIGRTAVWQNRRPYEKESVSGLSPLGSAKRISGRSLTSYTGHGKSWNCSWGRAAVWH